MTSLMDAVLRRFGAVAAVLAVAAWVGVGCEGGGGGGDDSGSSDFEGTWALYSGSTVSGSIAWYVHFNADGTFSITDNQDGTGSRVTGTYTVSDGLLVGPFTNPGVGDGRVEATIAGGVISLNFIEYWHTPYKEVPYAGTKL